MSSSKSAVSLARASIEALACDVLGGRDKASRWLDTPNKALGGRKPLDLLDTELGVREVEEILGRIDCGVYS
jgi:putative toxin-antitoxin system antitoxin component (TIGR02293 family)